MGHYLYSYFFKPKICIQLSPFVQRNCKIEIRQFVEMHICKCVSIANRRCGIRSAIFSLACSFLLLLVVTGLSGVVNCDRNCARQVLHLKLKYNKSFPENCRQQLASHPTSPLSVFNISPCPCLEDISTIFRSLCFTFQVVDSLVWNTLQTYPNPARSAHSPKDK